MQIKKVFVIGSGLMGSGIAQVCAQAGIKVCLYDISQQALDKALKDITWSVGKFIEKGTLKEDLKIVMGRISTSSRIAGASEADLIIEAVFERLDIKQEIFRQVDEVAKPAALIARNTSAIPITELASVTKRPEQGLGLHFLRPPPLMQ